MRAASALALAGLVACSDQPATSPSDAAGPALARTLKTSSDEKAVVGHPLLTRMNERLARTRSKLRVAKVELRYRAGYDAESPSVIFANNRTHTTPYRWVEGDPRRDGRTGVTYAVDPVLQTSDFGLNGLPAVEADGVPFRLSTQQELDGYIEEAMQAWRDRQCSDAPIQRVAVAEGTDPDQLDDLFLGRPSPSPTYVQPADIVQAGWQPIAFFEAFQTGGSESILGVTFTFVFVEDQNTPDPNDDVPTDIDGDGRLDTSLAEIYYNPAFIWTNRGADFFVDFFSVITHESGHSLSLAHFGKVFVTKSALDDGAIQLDEFKYAPKALMNAIYVTGRDEITGSDNGSFCQVWANNK
jgi:hypothetical protein